MYKCFYIVVIFTTAISCLFLGVSVDDLKGGHKSCNINACIKSGSLRFSQYPVVD